jgi:hypothetical protein
VSPYSHDVDIDTSDVVTHGDRLHALIVRRARSGRFSRRARVVAAGLSGAGFFGISATMAANPPSFAGSSTESDTALSTNEEIGIDTTSTTVSIETVHEVVYVDYSTNNNNTPTPTQPAVAPAPTQPDSAPVPPVTVPPKPPACSGTSC